MKPFAWFHVVFLYFSNHSNLILSTTAADFVSRNTASPDSIDTVIQTASLITPDSQCSDTSAPIAVLIISAINGKPMQTVIRTAALPLYISNPISHWKEVSRMNILDDLWYFIFHHGNIIKKDSLCLQHHGNGGCKSNGKMKNLCNQADISRYRLTKPEICVILIKK